YSLTTRVDVDGRVVTSAVSCSPRSLYDRVVFGTVSRKSLWRTESFSIRMFSISIVYFCPSKLSTLFTGAYGLPSTALGRSRANELTLPDLGTPEYREFRYLELPESGASRFWSKKNN